LLFVCGNKFDLADNRSVSEEEAREFSRSISAYYTETSARNNQNIAELFQELARQSAATLVNEDSLTVNDNTVDFSASEVPKKTCCL
jgi:GTPase SAR1 family protein